MATRTKPAAGNLYERDVYAWAGRQARLRRARRLDELDLENLIEEVEDLGGALRRSVRSRVRTIIEHLLKLEQSMLFSPAQRSGERLDLSTCGRRRCSSAAAASRGPRRS